MSAPLTPRRKLAAPVEKVVREKRKAAVGQSRTGSPSNVVAADADGPYLVHTSADLGRENPTPDPVPPYDGTHDVNNEMLAKAYRRGLRVGVGKKIVRQSLDFLFGEG